MQGDGRPGRQEESIETVGPGALNSVVKGKTVTTTERSEDQDVNETI